MPKRSRRGCEAAWMRSSIRKFLLRKPLRGRLALIVHLKVFAVSSICPGTSGRVPEYSLQSTVVFLRRVLEYFLQSTAVPLRQYYSTSWEVLRRGLLMRKQLHYLFQKDLICLFETIRLITVYIKDSDYLILPYHGNYDLRA